MLTISKLSAQWLAAVLLLLSGCCFGNSLWLYGKAQLAQLLIADAWRQTLQTGSVVKPWPWADTWPVGRLQIPEQQVDLYTLNGLSGNALAFGPGQLELPSVDDRAQHSRAVILAGHRDTHFRFMKALSLNESLFLTNRAGATTEYVVIELGIKDSRADAIEPFLDEQQQELWLVTCYPFDAISTNGPLRYVARAISVPSLLVPSSQFIETGPNTSIMQNISGLNAVFITETHGKPIHGGSSPAEILAIDPAIRAQFIPGISLQHNINVRIGL